MLLPLLLLLLFVILRTVESSRRGSQSDASAIKRKPNSTAKQMLGLMSGFFENLRP